MKLWGGRFTKETNELVNHFNASLPFDCRFYAQDIRGSIAHVTMLAKSGILTNDERDQIISGLTGILSDINNGTLTFDDGSEDIHSFVEAHLIERIGEAGKKLHTIPCLVLNGEKVLFGKKSINQLLDMLEQQE